MAELGLYFLSISPLCTLPCQGSQKIIFVKSMGV